MTAGELDAKDAAARSSPEVLTALEVSLAGLSSEEAGRRREQFGPNAILSHRTRPWQVLARQLRSPLLLLLAATAVASFATGERSSALIIGVILLASVGLGFVNEFRAERAAEALHDRMRRRTTVVRDGAEASIDVVDLVPGDIVELCLGQIVPADVRLLEVHGLECVESVLTGESASTEKGVDPSQGSLAELSSAAWMGTVVSSGAGRAVVVATGGRTEFGQIAAGLGERQPETAFQSGLRRFSTMLVEVAGALVVGIFVINLVLQRPLLEALLFALAIAVGISPQLLPAVVSTSLALGSRRLAECKVLVKRLVAIEDLGDVQVLFTDKTGTLTEGRIEFMRAIDLGPDDTLLLGLVCTESDMASGVTDALDAALWAAPNAPVAQARGMTRLDVLPFDHDRRLVSVLAEDGPTRRLVTKGAPEAVLERCVGVPPNVEEILGRELDAGHRVVAVASRPLAADRCSIADEHGLTFTGLLVLADPPKSSARTALERLDRLNIEVKVITGDHPRVAMQVCHELGLTSHGALTGEELARLDDDELARRLPDTTIFARVDPAQKARIVRAQRLLGFDVGFLGDGVNDALALHAADVGIAVDSGADVAKDAADVVLLEKELGVVADGVLEGRRIFANTIKYVLMGTSSNFGNMFSAAVASAILPFLPMLPSQILLNNLLYDASQLAIPTDRVDEEQLARPTHWDVGLIRRFMLVFGPISSIFDFLTFWIMRALFHADAATFRAGWFVESLATQALVLFVIRTRRAPFTRSKPSVPLTLSVLAAVGAGIVLPLSPLSRTLGFEPLPFGFFAALAAMVISYLALAQLVNRAFFRTPQHVPRYAHDRTRRRASGFSTSDLLPRS